MTLSVSDTLSGERGPFEPAGDVVTLYVCGLTTSDPPHVGHARTWVHADVIHRWLEYRGYAVRHVENLTDVNEKIVARVGEDGDSERDVARSYIEETIAAMRGLGLRRAAVYPRVTEHVPEIVDLVETLIERGHAYEADGSVYFDVTSFERYGALSNQDVDALEAQGDERELAEKRHPADFALWKADGVTPGEIDEHRHGTAAPAEEAAGTAMTWASPWGEGRPGWHVECSAMANTHLGDTFDIHVAGRDLVFPHNENEIAQSEAATGERFARYWCHVGLLETAGEKMSSSLGNFLTVEEALAEYGTNALRTFLLSAQYRQPQTYSRETLAEGAERAERLERAYDRACEAIDGPDAGTKAADEDLRDAVETAHEAFGAAMDDDFDTRGALAALLELAGAINRHVDADAPYDYRGIREAIEAMDALGGDVLGLSFGAATGGDGAASGDGDVHLAESVVELVLELREEERAAGNYDRADELRERLEALGVTVEDADDGPTFRL